ncbi:MAG: GntR family transcriptional regulator [Lachnospiraceae bacterium]|nr:GntR family transcriptional regulator [Lachnospiraceae bacterium]MBQ8246945.1 GntR family transcriptional regulator [Lachnospiraceae bacterium]
MNIIISNSSMQPIYEQVVSQVKQEILNGSLAPESKLPSVRELAGELRISALTVKKAYDTLEQEGFIVTVHGKGSFVAGVNRDLALEAQKKEVEKELDTVIKKAKSCGMTEEEITQLFELLMEE